MFLFVMAANAGIQVRFRFKLRIAWIPAFAGMTGMRVDFESANSETVGLHPRVVHLFFPIAAVH